MAYSYYRITGPDGPHDWYRIVLLDACVVAELMNLYRFGFGGIKNTHERSRLKGFLASRGGADEAFFQQGAIELGWRPVASNFNVEQIQKALSVVNYLCTLSPVDWRRVMNGAVPEALASAAKRRRFEEVTNGYAADSPSALTTGAVLAKGWELTESKVPWKDALDELERFCNVDLKYCPGLAVVTAALLIAGNTHQVSTIRALLKFGHQLSPKERYKRIRSAAWDLTFVDMVTQIVVQYRVARGEDLRPASAVTADKSLAELSLLLTRQIYDKDVNGRSRSTIRFPLSFFSRDRRDELQEFSDRISAGQQQRRNTDSQIENDQRYSILAAVGYMREMGDDSWAGYVEALNGTDAAWWNSKLAGHPANRFAAEQGWT